MSESHATLSYQSDVDIHGFQLNVSGVELTNAYDGVLEVQYSEETQNVIGVSILGEVLEQGTGTLVTFEFTPNLDGAILELNDIIVAGSASTPASLSLSLPGALEVIACDNADLDEYCDVLDECPYDFENDVDDDGVCGDVDICPHDPLNDIDGDGLCCGDANGDGVLSNDDGEEEEGECECYFNFFDCSGCCGGCAIEDDCNVCGGDTFFGDQAGDSCGCEGQVLDECGTCDSDALNDCVQDCAGVWGGDSWESDCGCVAADNSGDDCDDCAGVPNGTSELDDCGVCDDIQDNDNLSCTGCMNFGACNFDSDATVACNDCCLFFDCAGDCGGDAFIGSCDVCVGGETGLNELDLDLDLDGICNSDDICPEDYNNDIDGDGICGNIDECPIDVNNDSDGDGSCDSDDICPGEDDFLDTDDDTVVDCLDECPLDVNDDSDGDGSCDSDDICPSEDDFLDTDDDTVVDCLDECPLDANDDSDGDGSCDVMISAKARMIL